MPQRPAHADAVVPDTIRVPGDLSVARPRSDDLRGGTACGVASAGVSAPSGVVTFLFTDVEGVNPCGRTTRRRCGRRWAAHDEVLRAAIAAHGGRLFKHTGDGVCAAFASPSCAVDAAVAAQRELELPVRMGIATGEAELRGADYFGAVLNRAARVMAAGHGGQILGRVDGGPAQRT